MSNESDDLKGFMSIKRDRPPNLSLMEPMDIKEKYVKSLETIKELKKQNNSLQDAVKKLRVRLRWPEHLQIAVLNKEMKEQQVVLEKRIEELSIQCSSYEQQIDVLRAQKMRTQANDREQQKPNHSENFQSISHRSKSDANSSSMQAALQRHVAEWRDQEKAYKQQLEEALNRLSQTEERLAQILRLRTLDTAELIRLARSSKISAAQFTTAQDENNKLKLAAEQAQTKADELVGQLAEERERVIQLQEEVTQVQLLRQSLHDNTQELQDLRQECEVLKNHLKSVVSEASSAKPDDISTDSLEMLTHLRTQLADLQASLSESSTEKQRLESQLQAESKLRAELQCSLSRERQLLENMVKTQQQVETRKQELVAIREDVRLNAGTYSEGTRNSSTQTPKGSMKDKAVQTINTEVDFKPPEVACGLSGEESDRVLAQMYAELESHRELLRTQTHLSKLCKEEMETLQVQLQAERAQYAADFAEKVARLQEMQTLLTSQQPTEMCEVPKPAPRKTLQVKQPSAESLKETRTCKTLEIEIESLTAAEDSSLLSMDDSSRLFIEFMVYSEDSPKAIETPGSFPRPSVAGEHIPINYKHTLSESDTEVLLRGDTHLLFTVVAEPVEKESNDNAECEDMGSCPVCLGTLLTEPRLTRPLSLPMLADYDDSLVCYLYVSIRESDT